jgi:hypothetical protein
MGITALRVNDIETARSESRGVMSKPNPLKKLKLSAKTAENLRSLRNSNVPHSLAYPAASHGNALAAGFRHFIEHSNWDEDLLKYEKWIDAGCMAVIAMSFVFFLPVALSVFRG